MEIVFLVIQAILAVALVFIILIQRNASDGLSGLSGGSGSFGGVVSARASASFLTKTTAILATLFIINCLILGNLASKKSHKSLLDTAPVIEKNQEQEKEVPVSVPLAE